jgi:hypothetical protein
MSPSSMPNLVAVHPAVVGVRGTEEVDEQVLVREGEGERVGPDRTGHGLEGARL